MTKPAQTGAKPAAPLHRLHLAQRAYPMRLAEAIGWKPAWDMRERGGAIQIFRLLWRRLCLDDIHLCSEILRKLS
ncbi:MAG: hypothetical protein Q7R66_18540 [Undibacterium sp.]|uniref:hypothetical protein n=1 Tax=Undibacterium sp. TaxID=1914977 RepID=UPI00272153EB|nr:hypothetical protein [Undibacterium sp.]MDO8654174.1 hypothetical protein [Undibacterium sp.]